MYTIVDKRIVFYYLRNLCYGAHIDTGVIDYLNESDCITLIAKVVLRIPQKGHKNKK